MTLAIKRNRQGRYILSAGRMSDMLQLVVALDKNQPQMKADKHRGGKRDLTSAAVLICVHQPMTRAEGEVLPVKITSKPGGRAMTASAPDRSRRHRQVSMPRVSSPRSK